MPSGFGRHSTALLPLLLLTTICAASERSASDKNRSAGPPKEGIKTPGIQIPFASLQAEAQILLDGPVVGLSFGKDVIAALGKKNALAKIDVKSNKAETLAADGVTPCSSPVSAFDGLWIADCSAGKLAKLDLKAMKTAASAEVAALSAPGNVAASPDSLWLLSDARTTLSRVDPQTHSVVAEMRLPPQCSSIAYGEGALWATCPAENQLLRINALRNVVEQRIKVEGAPSFVTTGGGAVWVLTETEGNVVRVDPKTYKPTATIALKAPAKRATIAFGEGALWVSQPDFPLTRIDPATDAVVQQFFGQGSGLVLAGNGSIWLMPSGSKAIHRYDPKRVRATLAD